MNSALPALLTAVPSPCNDVCRIDARSGWCEGCLRSLDEIAAWGALDDDAKRAVWAALPLRRVDGADRIGGVDSTEATPR